jgi:hypothetical protein
MPWFSSLWWKDICSIGTNLNNNWFLQSAIKKLGNGNQTSFWRDTWVGGVPLRDLFPRLFSITTHKEVSVAGARRFDDGIGSWEILWRRRFFVWEQELFNELLDLINPISLLEEVDSWGWAPKGGEAFTVKSTYKVICGLNVPEVVVDQWHAFIFSAIWKCFAPSKVAGFVWQLLHGRVPTRSNLPIRRVILNGGDCSCVLCGEKLETVNHLFLYCEVAMLVWLEIFEWLQVSFGLPHNLLSLFNTLQEVGNKKLRIGFLMICCSVVWNLWKWRNAVLFDNTRMTVAELIESIKVSSWKWWLSKTSPSLCLFYEWRSEPRLCLLR